MPDSEFFDHQSCFRCKPCLAHHRRIGPNRLSDGLARVMSTWRVRRATYRALGAFSDSQLKDIGLSRDQLPFVSADKRRSNANANANANTDILPIFCA